MKEEREESSFPSEANFKRPWQKIHKEFPFKLFKIFSPRGLRSNSSHFHPIANFYWVSFMLCFALHITHMDQKPWVTTVCLTLSTFSSQQQTRTIWIWKLWQLHGTSTGYSNIFSYSENYFITLIYMSAKVMEIFVHLNYTLNFLFASEVLKVLQGWAFRETFSVFIWLKEFWKTHEDLPTLHS